jgi:hypothetical protein
MRKFRWDLEYDQKHPGIAATCFDNCFGLTYPQSCTDQTECLAGLCLPVVGIEAQDALGGGKRR